MYLMSHYDELTLDKIENQVFNQFHETPFMPTVFPTYKKFTKDRKFFELDDTENWIEGTYKMRYKVPWYKAIKDSAIQDV